VTWNVLNELIALRELILSSMLSFISLLTLALFERSEIMRRLLPSPERTAAEFVHALCTSRHANAHHLLATLARRLFRERDMEHLARRLHEGCGGVIAIRALDSLEGDGVASARVLLTTADGGERLVSFALERENALWKLSSPSALVLLPVEQAFVR
jgi:hypothetical protein